MVRISRGTRAAGERPDDTQGDEYLGGGQNPNRFSDQPFGAERTERQAERGGRAERSEERARDLPPDAHDEGPASFSRDGILGAPPVVTHQAGEGYVGTPGRAVEGEEVHDYGFGVQRRAGFAGRGPRGWKRSDERIREEVCERLTEDPYVDASDVDVEVVGCEVTLTGTVEGRRQKRRAEDVAAAVAGVLDVHNRIRIRRPASAQSSNGGERRDSWNHPMR